MLPRIGVSIVRGPNFQWSSWMTSPDLTFGPGYSLPFNAATKLNPNIENVEPR